MMQREWQIGIVGTFDVQNYGDLLFPILAESELRARLGAVRLHRFSYHARTPPSWPYEVTSLSELPARLPELDALLVGGGFLIRFDKFIADDYEPPSPDIHHPTGYWLTPALMALAHGIPVAWNAPGMHRNAVPRWAEPLVRLALGESEYVAVRDVPTRDALSHFADPARLHLVPDTAFAVAKLLPSAESEAMQRLRREVGLTKPYVVVQPIRWTDDRFPRFLARHASRFADYQLLALPIGPVLGDELDSLGRAASQFVRLPSWPDPLLVAELIARASAVVGYSYHLAITALAAGVPVFTSVDVDAGKYTALREHESVYRLASLRDGDAEAFFARLGRRAPDAATQAKLPRVDQHWDRIADAVRRGRRTPGIAMSRFWQSLPSQLEPAVRRSAVRRLLSFGWRTVRGRRTK